MESQRGAILYAGIMEECNDGSLPVKNKSHHNPPPPGFPRSEKSRCGQNTGYMEPQSGVILIEPVRFTK